MHNDQTIFSSKVTKMNDDADKATVRTRPTNNQLLYKAYFRWHHYPVPVSPIYEVKETDACASVTAAFLQVMSILQEVEAFHCPEQRNILKILSQDTRHTKIVNLACGTHRVSEELKRHSLTDIDGTQYTTNLDRNRYGADNQYMVTVIRHNLCMLGLCPCLVDVEILDQKNNESTMVSAELESCVCTGVWKPGNKNDKLSCDGLSCSPGSSTQSEEKSSWKSTSSGQNPNCSKKLNFRQTRSDADNYSKNKGTAKGCGSGISMMDPMDCSRSITNAPIATTTVSTRRQGPSRRVKNKWKKVIPMNIDDNHVLPPPPQSMHTSFDYDVDDNHHHHVVHEFGKRNRDSDSGEGTHWAVTNTNTVNKGRVINGQQESKNTTMLKSSPGSQTTKRLKSDFHRLNLSSDRILDEVLQMKTKLNCMDPMKCRIEEDTHRIQRIEADLMSLRMEVKHFICDSRQMEAQLVASRRIIGMLLNRLEQLTTSKQDCCLHIEDQQNGFQFRNDETEALISQTNPSTPSPYTTNTNTTDQGLDDIQCNDGNKGLFDSDWTATNTSLRPTRLPGILTSPKPKQKQHIMKSSTPSLPEKLNSHSGFAQTSPTVDCSVLSMGLTEGPFELGFDSMLSLERQELIPSGAWNSQEARFTIGQK